MKHSVDIRMGGGLVLGKDIRVCNSMQCDAVDIRMGRGLVLGKDIRVCNSMQCSAVDIRMVRGAVEQEQQLPLMTALP